MISSTIQKATAKPGLPEFETYTPKKRGLAASWYLVNGRLVCKWFPSER